MGNRKTSKYRRAQYQRAAERPDLFDASRYPNLRRQCRTRFRGLCTILSVSETSDGFLMGWASFEQDGKTHEHSVFLGTASDYTGEGLTMSHFYGLLSGQAGTATRCGSERSGFVTVAASWAGCISVRLWRDSDGNDCFRVDQEPWQGAGVHQSIASGILGKPQQRDRT